MSYLGCPRIHIAGTFFTNPGNLNDIVRNFQADAPERLSYDTGKYQNPEGVAQFWLQACVITSVVTPDGVICSSPSSDALVGATVQSARPEAPIPNGKKGHYDVAKIADLDPNMQQRAELYGLNVLVNIPGGGSFSGHLTTPPQLRDLFFGRGDAGIAGLQVAVGTWHQRLTDVVWSDPPEPSAVYRALKAEGVTELDLKLVADMYQTDGSGQSSAGNRFAYGRLMGSIGPALPNEPRQVVPGRSLYGVRTPGLSGRATVSESPTSSADHSLRRGEQAAAEDRAKGTFWGRTDCRVQDLPNGKSILLIDLSGAAPLADGQKGKFDLGGALTVGCYEGEVFTPLSGGAIHLDYSALGAGALELKDCVWPSHSAIVQIALTADERRKIASTPLAIRSGQAVMLAENQTGLYIDVDTVTTRLPAHTMQVFDLWVYAFGVPQTSLPPGLRLAPQLMVDQLDPGDNRLVPTDLFSAEVATQGTLAGKFALTVRTYAALEASEMPLLRRNMDSLLCSLQATGQSYVVGEANYQPPGYPPKPPLMALLFWQDSWVVAKPTWEANICPILRRYALLYPGMKSRLDISDLATVTAYRELLLACYAAPRTAPEFMPIVRDMSPATVNMMISFLDTLGSAGAVTAGDNRQGSFPSSDETPD
jgi:hypothetical protein